MREADHGFAVLPALGDGVRAAARRPVLVTLQLGAVSVGVALQAVYTAFGGAAGTSADEMERAVVAASVLAIPIRAFVAGMTMALVLDRATPAQPLREAWDRTIARYPELLLAVALPWLPGMAWNALTRDLGWTTWLLVAAVGEPVLWWIAVKLTFLPAVVAAGEGRTLLATLRAAWRVTDDLWWRTFRLTLAVLLPVGLLGLPVGLLVGSGAVGVPLFVWPAVLFALANVSDLFFAAAYRQIVDGPTPDGIVPAGTPAPVV